MKFCDW